MSPCVFLIGEVIRRISLAAQVGECSGLAAGLEIQGVTTLWVRTHVRCRLLPGAALARSTATIRLRASITWMWAPVLVFEVQDGFCRASSRAT